MAATKRNTGWPQPDRSKLVSKRTRAFLLLCTCALFSVIYVEEISKVTQRQLRCRKIAKGESYDDNLRSLVAFTDTVDNMLQGGGEEDYPCITDFPDDVEEQTVDEEVAKAINEEEPVFEVAADDDDEFLAQEEEDGSINLVPEEEGEMPLPDQAEIDLIESFEPEEYNPVKQEAKASSTDDDTIAYVVPIQSCPESYEPKVQLQNEPKSPIDLYEASAILKTEVCAVTDNAVAERKLGHTRKLENLGDQLSAAEMEYAMHAIVHPEATKCNIEGTDETYNRVKLLQSQNYQVEILGQPITADALSATNPELLSNLQSTDVGIRDSIKLHAWAMDNHPAVVLLDYDSLLQGTFDEEIDTLLADGTMKGMYVETPTHPDSGESGVDVGFMIIKPSKEEFKKIVDSYINTPFDMATGWNGQGHHRFEGGLGISGFLSYYFNNNDGYKKLDRCTYAHAADDFCIMEKPVRESKRATIKTSDQDCGNPRDCPYDDPRWSIEKKETCKDIHRKYFEYRYEFEERFFNKKLKQEPIGLFKPKNFLGYCTGPGHSNYLSLTQSIIPVPDWQTICPPKECPAGSYRKHDCSCTQEDEDPCSACPDNTVCQQSPVLMCIDCNCGFCDQNTSECCDFNGVNNCKSSGVASKECAMQRDFFPAFKGAGNVCGGVEISRTAVPNGCGCKPNSYSPCVYNPNWGNMNSKCFICTAADLAQGLCANCKTCMSTCSMTKKGGIRGDTGSTEHCMNTSSSMDEYMSCIASIDDAECRAKCHQSCMKSEEDKPIEFLTPPQEEDKPVEFLTPPQYELGGWDDGIKQREELERLQEEELREKEELDRLKQEEIRQNAVLGWLEEEELRKKEELEKPYGSVPQQDLEILIEEEAKEEEELQRLLQEEANELEELARLEDEVAKEEEELVRLEEDTKNQKQTCNKLDQEVLASNEDYEAFKLMKEQQHQKCYQLKQQLQLLKKQNKSQKEEIEALKQDQMKEEEELNRLKDEVDKRKKKCDELKTEKAKQYEEYERKQQLVLQKQESCKQSKQKKAEQKTKCTKLKQAEEEQRTKCTRLKNKINSKM